MQSNVLKIVNSISKELVWQIDNGGNLHFPPNHNNPDVNLRIFMTTNLYSKLYMKLEKTIKKNLK
jgi:hypothetical protein